MQKLVICGITLTLISGCTSVYSPPNFEDDVWEELGKKSVIKTDIQYFNKNSNSHPKSQKKEAEETVAQNTTTETFIDSSQLSQTVTTKYTIAFQNIKCNDSNINQELCEAYAFADLYRKKYLDYATDAYGLSSALGYTGLLAGIAGTAASAFSWHADALKVSAITLGSALGISSYSQPTLRSKQYIQAANRMQCIVNTSSKIVRKYTILSPENIETEAKSAIVSLKSILNFPIQELINKKNMLKDDTDAEAIRYLSELIEVHTKISSQKEEISKSIYKNSALVTGMPFEIVSTAKQADLKFRKAFIDSTPDFNESLKIIKNSMSQQLLANSEENKLTQTLPNNNDSSTRLVGVIDDAELIKKIKKLKEDIAKLNTSLVLINSYSMNYAEVSNDLKLCIAI